MNIFGCFGGGHKLDYYEYYYGVNVLGNVQLFLTTSSCYNWNMIQDGLSSLVTTGHKQILGLNSTNESGGTPAHILNTSPIAGYDKSILELRNNGNIKMRVDAEGGLHTGYLILGGYYIFVDPATGKLLIKNGPPASNTDGTVIGSQT